MEGPRLVLLILVFFFLFVSPDTKQSSPSQQRELGQRIEGLQQALSTLRNTTYGDFDPAEHRWLNSTGLREDDGFNWQLLRVAQKAARIQLLQLFAKSGGVTQKDLEEGEKAAYESVGQDSLPLYQNVSGDVRGKFSRRPVPKFHSQVNFTALGLNNTYVTDEFQRNITESEGELKVRLVEDVHADEVSGDASGTHRTIKTVSAEMAIITDSSPGNGWEMKLYGTHFLPSGSILLTTTSEKFNGIFSLPSFALSEADYGLSRELLSTSLADTVSRWERNKETNIPFSSSHNSADAPLFPVPSCEYVVYLQQHPVNFANPRLDSEQAHGLITQIERELRNPDGASIPQPPAMTFSAVLYSPDCGFVLESESSGSSYHLSGPKSEVYWTLVRRLIVAFAMVLGMQIALLKRQMDEASTPSTRSRIAYQSLGIMAYGDGLIISGFIWVLILNDTASLMVMAASFLCLLNVAFFEMKFIFDIWTVQVGDPRQRERDREQRAAAAAPPAGNTPTDLSGRPAIDTSSGFIPGLPLPVTAPRPVDTGATPIILPPDQDIDAAQAEDGLEGRQANDTPVQRSRGLEFSAIYTRFYFTLIVLMFFSLWAFSWPRTLRSAYVDILCFAYLSFWVPQIYRNVMRNCRQALKWEYVVGISILRLTPIVYCYTKQNNTLSIDVDWTAAYILVGWVWLQVLALASQQFLGPRLFVKEIWCPPAYEYHPLLHDDKDDVEAGATLPIGFVASASQAKDMDANTKEKGGGGGDRKIFDCAICMNEIDVPVVTKTNGKDVSGMGSSWLERRNYMVTPCRHIFHSQCLEGWMRLRLVCPICREGLPPL